MTIAEVRMWGRTIGAVRWNDSLRVGEFQYDPGFAQSSIQISPVKMPLGNQIYSFPALPPISFKGLPGLLADSLPDDYGNALIDSWLAKEGRAGVGFNAVERLCYTGRRGMGALEYFPVAGPAGYESDPVNIAQLMELAKQALAQKGSLLASLDSDVREDSLNQILQVGTSAGGARPKAIIAWNEETNEVKTGQVSAGDGFTYWLLKFDGLTDKNDEQRLENSGGYGLIEFAYSVMAKSAGIEMSECRLLEEGKRNHFMTKRFDRSDGFERFHMQTLAALEHFDYRSAGAYSYEQAFQTIRNLDLSMDSIEQMFRRVVFNIVARNQDDHVKNISFLMDKHGQWTLSPAYDVTYSYNPQGEWTSSHQMTLNGKNRGFVLTDFIECSQRASMKRGVAQSIVEEVVSVVEKWPDFAEEAQVPEEKIIKIGKAHRLDILEV